MNAPREKDARRTAWWLRGDERCSSCEQTYVLEMEYRCWDCDASICPICAVIVSRTKALCPGCDSNE